MQGETARMKKYFFFGIKINQEMDQKREYSLEK
jgi:hypothetical protein